MLRAFMRSIPFNQWLGIEVVAAHEDGITISCRMRPEMRNGHGVLHGGGDCDACRRRSRSGVEAAHRTEDGDDDRLESQLLEASSGRDVVGAMYLVRVGRTLITGRVELTDDQGKTIAIAIASYMVID